MGGLATSVKGSQVDASKSNDDDGGNLPEVMEEDIMDNEWWNDDDGMDGSYKTNLRTLAAPSSSFAGNKRSPDCRVPPNFLNVNLNCRTRPLESPAHDADMALRQPEAP